MPREGRSPELPGPGAGAAPDHPMGRPCVLPAGTRQPDCGKAHDPSAPPRSWSRFRLRRKEKPARPAESRGWGGSEHASHGPEVPPRPPPQGRRPPPSPTACGICTLQGTSGRQARESRGHPSCPRAAGLPPPTRLPWTGPLMPQGPAPPEARPQNPLVRGRLGPGAADGKPLPPSPPDAGASLPAGRPLLVCPAQPCRTRPDPQHLGRVP